MRFSTLSDQEDEGIDNEAISKCFSCFLGVGENAKKSERVRGEDEVRFRASTLEEERGCGVAPSMRFEEELQ